MKFLTKIILLIIAFNFLAYSSIFACDTSPVITLSNNTDLGNGTYSIDIEVCVGDGGSLAGWTTDFVAGDILSWSPTDLVNGTHTATGSVAGGVLTYFDPTGTPSNMFVEDFTNTCLSYNVVIDVDPTGTQVLFSGVNCLDDDCPGSCSVIDGDDQTAVVPGPPPIFNCGDVFTDGPGNYLDNSNITYQICPSSPSNPVTLDFTVFDLELNFDFLTICDNDTPTGLLVLLIQVQIALVQFLQLTQQVAYLLHSSPMAQ